MTVCELWLAAKSTQIRICYLQLTKVQNQIMMKIKNVNDKIWMVTNIST